MLSGAAEKGAPRSAGLAGAAAMEIPLEWAQVEQRSPD